MPAGSPPQSVAAGIEVVDLEYLGERNSVAAILLTGKDGIAVIDPGPSTTLPVLRARLADRGASLLDVAAILLTHIHLDHGGAAGTIVAENPRTRVYVHERGAPHVVDPSRLLRSATRIYGEDQMQRLWGEVRPVPVDRLRVLGDADTLDVIGRRLRSVYTPGHAWHHVAYLDELSGVACVGDTAGERFPGQLYVLPVTPPPDVDLDQWRASAARLSALKPAHLIVTHFGAFPDPARHLAEHGERLEQWAVEARRSLDESGSDADRAERFATRIEAELRRSLPGLLAQHYAGSLRSSWDGLARYWRTGAPERAKSTDQRAAHPA